MPGNNILITVIITAILIWQSVLTYLFVKVLYRYKKLAKLESVELEKKLTARLSEKVDLLEKKELEHIQKVSLLRFNPFKETGGDSSFTLCLLDAKLDGVVLTGLHTREKTRVYAKEIINGKSKLDLSEEEKKVIKNAENKH